MRSTTSFHTISFGRRKLTALGIGKQGFFTCHPEERKKKELEKGNGIWRKGITIQKERREKSILASFSLFRSSSIYIYPVLLL